jgi:hypothetical protein
MRNLFVLALALLFISGCTDLNPNNLASIAPATSHGITFSTGLGFGGKNVSALPQATESQQYSAAITPLGGSPPYTCQSVPGGSVIAGTIQLNPDCSVSGVAPALPSGQPSQVYPVQFTITDSNGTVAGPFGLSLLVVGVPQQPPPGCPSPYDGTWQGTMLDSGELSVTSYNGGPAYPGATIQNPTIAYHSFTAGYHFEMTIQCNNGAGEGSSASWEYNITYLNASDPLFDCSAGCTPESNPAATPAYLEIGANGTGTLSGLAFPNGATVLGVFTNVQVSPDGNTMTLSNSGGDIWSSIGALTAPDGTTSDVETETSCQQYGGPSVCGLYSIDPITITLTKVS